MREDVLIILNEREPLKQQMAVELAKQLAERSVSCERLKPTGKLSQVLRERNAAVVILDYLLGDHGTALDILTDLQLHDSPANGEVIVWTDEPSVNVAVSAMKLGAADYVEIGSANSLEKVLQSVERCLRENQDDLPSQERRRTSPTYEPPVGQNKTFSGAISVAASLGARNANVVVLLGPAGSGRNTFAQHIHRSRPTPGSMKKIDFDLFSKDVMTICGGPQRQVETPLLSYGATVLIDHAETDPGELLSGVEAEAKTIWAPSTPAQPMLIIGTSSEDTARAWAKLLSAEIVEIPALAERRDDFLPLLQRFAQEAQTLVKGPKVKFSVGLLERLAALEWPGNVRELRAAAIEALTMPPPEESRSTSDEEEGPANSKFSRTEQVLYRRMVAAKLRWERYHRESSTTLLQPFAVRRVVDESAGNLRIAAARLGVSISAVRTTLSQQAGPALQQNRPGAA